MQELIDYLGLDLNYTQELLIVALILARTVPMIFLSPFFAGKIAPPEVKWGLSIVFCLTVWPVARPAALAHGPVPYQALLFSIIMLKEVFVGFCIGFLNAHVFWAMDMAGRLIDTARGTSMSEVQDPHSKQRVTPFGDMYTQLLLIFFMLFGGHQLFLEAYLYSFQTIPLNGFLPDFFDIGQFSDFMIRTTASIFLLALLLAAPTVAATLITDTVFGILNRVAPQLNAYFMSMPVKAMAGVVMVLVAMDAFVARAEWYTVWALQMVGRSIELLSGANNL